MRDVPLRRPWWPIAGSAIFFGYFALIFGSDLRRPEPFGIKVALDDAGMRLESVDPGSPAARADLRAGDRVRQIGEVTVGRRIDVLAADTHLKVGRPIRLILERDGSRLERTASVGLAPWRYWMTRAGIGLLTVRGVQLVTLLLACVLLVKRPRDPHAIRGAWLLATVSTFSVTLPYGLTDMWRHLPPVIGALLFAPFVNSVALGAVGFTFFATFPRPLIHGRVRWAIVWLPMAAALSWHAWYGWHLVYRPDRIHLVPDWSWFLVGVSTLYGVALVAALMLNYQRLQEVNDRRRLRVLVAGTLVGSLSGGPVAVLFWIGPARDAAAPLFASPLATLGALVFLAFPLSFAYAILRHRLFDVSVIIRRGLQYALARRVLVSAVPALAILFAIDLLLHGNRPLIDTLRARGAIYAVLGALAIVAHARREVWLAALDRRFFRERYNAQQILRRIVEDIRTGGDLAAVAARLVAQVRTALHPTFVALLAGAEGDPWYKCVAAAPPDHAPGPLRRDMRVLAVIGVLKRPANVTAGESGWMRRELPAEEETYLTRNGVELLVPVGDTAVLVLGAKQSEEPYSGEDEDLLAAIGDSLAIRLAGDEQAAVAASRAFEECPSCGSCYDSGTGACVHEGAALRRVAMPRVLAHRYRLERRLGHGGMGTVYAASDTALMRRVAAKVIRDDLLAATDAAERFQREAQLAATLSHPNVVTVYDFGIFENRAFLVMELLEGVTLRDRLRTDGRLDPAPAIEILRAMCAAIDAAHRQHLVHRDLKPENIFLCETPHGHMVKVLDFGIAKTLAASEDWTRTPHVQTADGVLLGTLPYMAPEQLRGESVAPAWDLWALGVIAHEILLGRHPFAAPAGWPAPTTAAAAAGECDPALRDFFARALSPDPAERFPTASAFLVQLERGVAR